MNPEAMVIAGDDIGREVIPLAVECLLAVRPDAKLWYGEGGDDEARREGFPINVPTAEYAIETGTVLMGPERPPHTTMPRALDVLTELLDLHCTLYPVTIEGQRTLILAEHYPGEMPPAAAITRLTPEQNWSATRLGNVGGDIYREQKFKRVALAHDSEEDFSFAVMGGLGEDIKVDRLDAVYLVNEFRELAREYPLILMSAATATQLIPIALRQSGTLPQAARLFKGTRGVVAGPVHGPLRSLVGWGFVNPLGAINAAAALLRYGWHDGSAADRLETAILHATHRRRTPDMGGVHTMYEVTRAIVNALGG